MGARLSGDHERPAPALRPAASGLHEGRPAAAPSRAPWPTRSASPSPPLPPRRPAGGPPAPLPRCGRLTPLGRRSGRWRWRWPPPAAPPSPCSPAAKPSAGCGPVIEGRLGITRRLAAGRLAPHSPRCRAGPPAAPAGGRGGAAPPAGPSAPLVLFAACGRAAQHFAGAPLAGGRAGLPAGPPRRCRAAAGSRLSAVPNPPAGGPRPPAPAGALARALRATLRGRGPVEGRCRGLSLSRASPARGWR